MMGGMFSRGMGFDGWKDYVHSGFWNESTTFRGKPAPIATYPKMIMNRFFRTKTCAEMQEDAKDTSSVELKRTLVWYDLIALGVGFMCGAGIFVSPGYIANAITGPALFLAYFIAAVSAFLSSFCYAEFTSALPMAGAAYNYVYSTLGEFIAWVTVSNLILEYILANAAAVRGFAPYLAVLFNKPSNFFLRNWNGYILDGWACGVTIFVTILLTWGIKESTTINNILTAIHVIIMFFIIIAGLTKANTANFQPFFKKGATWKSVFNGASIAFFSFIGFDALATTAEEMKDPERDMPIGILGAVGTVTIIYVLMCVTLCLMVPTPDIAQTATFAAAFDYVGMSWAKYIVSIGALIGIFTTTLIGVLGAARILVGCCRERMLPPFLAIVGERRQTPWVATWAIGLCSAGIALFSDFAELANMISIGTFIVFYVVAVALLWLRSYAPGKTTRKGLIILLVNLFAVIGFALGFTCVWCLPTYADAVADYGDYIGSPAGSQNENQWKWLVAMGTCFIASVFVFWLTVKQDYIPEGYKVPLFPFIPAGSIFVNCFLLGQLDEKSYIRFAWWTVAAAAIYFVYGAVAQESFEHRDLLPHSLSDSDPSAMKGVVNETDIPLPIKIDKILTDTPSEEGVAHITHPGPISP